jgi:hypothetical protein
MAHAAARSPDGNLVASASGDGTLKLWEAAAGECRATLRGHDAYLVSCTFSPDGATLASCSGDGSAKLWSVATALRGVTRRVKQARRRELPGAPLPLHAAAAAGQVTAVALLLRYGADVTRADRQGRTPLHAAAAAPRDAAAVCAALLAAGASADARDASGRTPAELATDAAARAVLSGKTPPAAAAEVADDDAALAALDAAAALQAAELATRRATDAEADRLLEALAAARAAAGAVTGSVDGAARRRAIEACAAATPPARFIARLQAWETFAALRLPGERGEASGSSRRPMPRSSESSAGGSAGGSGSRRSAHYSG